MNKTYRSTDESFSSITCCVRNNSVPKLGSNSNKPKTWQRNFFPSLLFLFSFSLIDITFYQKFNAGQIENKQTNKMLTKTHQNSKD